MNIKLQYADMILKEVRILKYDTCNYNSISGYKPNCCYIKLGLLIWDDDHMMTGYRGPVVLLTDKSSGMFDPEICWYPQ